MSPERPTGSPESGKARRFGVAARWREFAGLLRRGGQPRYAFAFSLLLIALVWAIAGVRLASERRQALDTALAHSANLARVFEAHAVRTFAAADAMLRQLESAFEEHGAALDLHAFVARQMTDHEPYQSLIVLDANGRVVVSEPDLRRRDLRGWPVYRALASGETTVTLIGKPELDVVTAGWTFNVARPLRAPDGTFRGAVAVGIDPGYFSRLYDAVKLGREATVLLVGLDGIVRARGANATTAPGEDVSRLPVFRALAGAAEGRQAGSNMLDGIPRLFVHRRVAGYPLAVVVGTSQSSALETYHRMQRQYIATAVGFSLLVVLFAALSMRLALRESATSRALLGSESQRRQAQAEREYFAQLVHSSSEAIVSRTLDGTILSWNRAAERLFGYTVDEVIGRPIDIIVPEELRREVRKEQARFTPIEPLPSREDLRLAKDGRRIRVALSEAPIRSATGDVTAISMIARDITQTKLAELALQESEARLRQAQRLAHVGSWELDIASKRLVWSDEIYRIFELDRARFGASYHAFLQYVHPADRANVDRAYSASLVARTPYSIDHRLLMPDGRVKHVHEECVTDYDATGRPVRSLGTVQDITERKLAEEARARLATIVENAADAILSRTLEGTITSWNAAAERLLGYAAADVIGRPVDVVMGQTRERLREVTERLVRGETLPAFESERPHQDGSMIPVLVTISPVRNDAGEVTGVALILRDLREEKKAHERQRLAAGVFEHAAEGILVTDAENRIVSVNQAFTRITGYTAAEVIGRDPRLLSAGLQSAQFYSAMWRAIASQRLWQGEVWDKRKNGEIYCQSLSISTIVDDAGRVRNHCAIFMDITQRKNAEAALLRLNAELEERVVERTRALADSNERLREANEELNAFSYSVSHDLRGPLRRVHGYTAMALGAVDTAEGRLREWLERVRVNTESMGRLVEDLLRLSLVTRKDLHVEPFDLSTLAHEVAASLQERDEARRVTVGIEPGLQAVGDPDLVRILLENLLGNAWKFTRKVPDARITVGRLAAPGEPAYFVQDNGAGFDMARAGELFKPFKRLHRTEDYEGTGVGLSIVYRIVAKHGGAVWAQSAPEAGARFFFTLGGGERDARAAQA